MPLFSSPLLSPLPLPLPLAAVVLLMMNKLVESHSDERYTLTGVYNVLHHLHAAPGVCYHRGWTR